ncbi:hypothetical protein [Desulfopila sp. IMCC35008]|uniref:hypothetical protein n=1 Tax=Desulfopila sp. IMCC35008 TaxID=2653858 RepID=UPI0013D30DF3|nr:hypothetical protein [Desulfopila sp. IMCC35008]
MIFTQSWNRVSKEQIIPSTLIDSIQHGGKPGINLGDFVGKELQSSFLDIKALVSLYYWDVVFPGGNFYKSGGGSVMHIVADL